MVFVCSTKFHLKTDYFCLVGNHFHFSSLGDLSRTVAMVLFTGGSIKYSALLNFLMWRCPSSFFQFQITISIPLRKRFFSPVVANTSIYIGCDLSILMSSPLNLFVFEEMLTMTKNLSMSYPTLYLLSIIERKMWQFLLVETKQKI